MRYKVSKPTHGSQEWLTARWQDENGMKRVSASNAAAIYNQHAFKTAADLATELLADNPPQPLIPTQAMERGSRIEPFIIDWVSDIEGIKLTTPDELFCFSEGKARMVATIDAMDEQGRVFEIKTMSRRWDGKLPYYWYWQGVQQAICVGVNKIHWRVFDSDMVIHEYTQEVTSDEMQMHISAVAEFLSSIDDGKLPDGVKLSYQNAAELYNKPIAKQVLLPEAVLEIIETLDALKVQKKKIDEIESETKATLGMLMRDAEEGIVNGEVVITWKQQKRTVFDSARFDAEHPALSQKYRKTTEFRVMKTKGKK